MDLVKMPGCVRFRCILLSSDYIFNLKLTDNLAGLDEPELSGVRQVLPNAVRWLMFVILLAVL